MRNYIYYKEWDEVTYLFTNINGDTAEVWELISNFVPHVLGMWLPIYGGIKINPY